jgi:hypothetical protein
MGERRTAGIAMTSEPEIPGGLFLHAGILRQIWDSLRVLDDRDT